VIGCRAPECGPALSESEGDCCYRGECWRARRNAAAVSAAAGLSSKDVIIRSQGYGHDGRAVRTVSGVAVVVFSLAVSVRGERWESRKLEMAHPAGPPPSTALERTPPVSRPQGSNPEGRRTPRGGYCASYAPISTCAPDNRGEPRWSVLRFSGGPVTASSPASIA